MTGAEFTVDQDALAAYLSIECLAHTGAAPKGVLTFQDFADDGLHHLIDEFFTELLDQHVIKRPAGWTIAIYVLDDDDQWAYLPTVRSHDEHPWEHRPFVQLTELTQEVRLHWEVADSIVGLVDLLNRLLPAAEAALAAMVR